VRFCLRDYKPEDFRTLWMIDQGCFPRGIAYTQFELKTYIHRPTSFTIVAEAEEQRALSATGPASPPDASSLTRTAGLPFLPAIIGFIVAERARSEGHIITIDVRSEGRRSGVGSALLKAAEERLRLWNCPEARLETAVDNASALGFYKKHGYSVTKIVPRYYSNGVDALVLGKDLLSSPASANVQK
jgi:[ribosomal protein S18]-alanine N-acetyltransferase